MNKTQSRKGGESVAEGGAKKPKSGKGSQLLVRITQDLRDAMDREAAETGRSLAQVAEFWLERGREELMGGSPLSPTMQEMVRFARAVQSELGDPSIDAAANEAIRRGWTVLARSVRLRPSEGVRRLVEADERVVDAALALVAALADAERVDPADPVVQSAVKGVSPELVAFAPTGLFGSAFADVPVSRGRAKPSLQSILRELVSVGRERASAWHINRDDAAEATDRALAAGGAAQAELAAFRAALGAFQDASAEFGMARGEAEAKAEAFVSAHLSPLRIALGVPRKAMPAAG